MTLPPKKYDAPSELICQMLAETFTKISCAEEHLSLDFAKRLIDLQERKRKSINTHNLSDSFPWLYQLGFLKYRRVYLPRGGWSLMLYKSDEASESAIRSAMQGRPWVLDGKWHSRETQEAIARGGNPYPPFVSPPEEHEIKAAVMANPEIASAANEKRKKKKKKKKSTSESGSDFVKRWTEVISELPIGKKKRKKKPDSDFTEKWKSSIKELPSKRRKKAAESIPAPVADPVVKKKKCCDNPHVVRSKKTGKRFCKNCGKKYKTKV